MSHIIACLASSVWADGYVAELAGKLDKMIRGNPTKCHTTSSTLYSEYVRTQVRTIRNAVLRNAVLLACLAILLGNYFADRGCEEAIRKAPKKTETVGQVDLEYG